MRVLSESVVVTSKKIDRQALEKRLVKIEKELEKVRGASPITHGWQTQRYAQASRKWDQLCIEKREILSKLEGDI